MIIPWEVSSSSSESSTATWKSCTVSSTSLKLTRTSEVVLALGVQPRKKHTPMGGMLYVYLGGIPGPLTVESEGL